MSIGWCFCHEIRGATLAHGIAASDRKLETGCLRCRPAAFLVLFLSLALPVLIAASPVFSEQPAASLYAVGLKNDSGELLDSFPDVKGWGYVSKRLLTLGVDRKVLLDTLQNEKMPSRDELIFNLQPKEPRSMYRLLNTKKNRANALSFYRDYSAYFEAAEKSYGVDRSVILALLQVETGCGTYLGNSPVFPALLRLAAATDPKNIESNLKYHKALPGTEKARQVKQRAKYLEDTFLPHAAAVFKVAKGMGLPPLGLRGSRSGAIGLPQFLPGNQGEFGVDGDRDGVVNLFSAPDAILSVGNFLHRYGWKKNSIQAKRTAIWHYNRSQPYIDTVLAMANDLTPSLPGSKSSNKTVGGKSEKVIKERKSSAPKSEKSKLKKETAR